MKFSPHKLLLDIFIFIFWSQTSEWAWNDDLIAPQKYHLLTKVNQSNPCPAALRPLIKSVLIVKASDNINVNTTVWLAIFNSIRKRESESERKGAFLNCTSLAQVYICEDIILEKSSLLSHVIRQVCSIISNEEQRTKISYRTLLTQWWISSITTFNFSVKRP